MSKKNKYVDKYRYKNYITQCPNCGGNLKETDYDCPFCGINLVGHNEKYNMANNMSNYAKEISNIAEKHNQLNERIRKNNNKIKNKERKPINKKLLSIIIAVVIGIILIASFILGIISNIGAKSYDEVKDYFNNFSPETINAKQLDYTFEVEKEDYDYGYDSQLTLQTGYDKSNKLTVFKEIFTNDNDEVSIIRIYENDIASLPKTTLSYNKVSYDCGKYAYININDYFIQDNNISADEYVLANYIDSDKNYVTKLPTLNIDGTEIFLYHIDTAPLSNDSEYVIGIVELSDNILFVSRIIVYDTEVGDNPVLDNLEKYFYIIEE